MPKTDTDPSSSENRRDPRVRVISCPDFLRRDVDGHLDQEEMRRALREIADECVQKGVRSALLDVREVSGAPTLSELFWIAEELTALGFARLERLAILYTNRGEGRATFFATAARSRGFRVREFTDFEAAFDWLCAAAPARERDESNEK
jgi:hypothetical protein